LDERRIYGFENPADPIFQKGEWGFVCLGQSGEKMSSQSPGFLYSFFKNDWVALNFIILGYAGQLVIKEGALWKLIRRQPG